MTTTTRTLETAIAFVDAQDPSDLAWAYRLTYDDGHQESGPMDTDIGDESGAILDELRELVGGAWEAGRWEYRDAEHGSYVWRAGRRPMTETTPDGPTYPVTITVALLEQRGACDEELAAFRAACPSGELVIPDAVAHLAALSGPLAEFEERAVTAGILPPLVSTAGYGGTAIAGHRGTATAGYGGTAVAGRGGTASAGYGGAAVAGDYGTAVAAGHGTATAGYGGTAVAGDGGTAIAGREGAATAGYGGVLVARWWDEEADRLRVAVAYVGEHAPGLPDGEVIQPDVPYRIEVVGDRPMWRRVEVTP